MRTEDSGLMATEISILVAIAPLEHWQLAWDEEQREWVTAVTCPGCGERLVFAVSALDDFYCSVCDYEPVDGTERPPAPADL